MLADDRGPVLRFLGWLWRDGPVWLVVGALLFLVIVNLPRIGVLP